MRPDLQSAQLAQIIVSALSSRKTTLQDYVLKIYEEADSPDDIVRGLVGTEAFTRFKQSQEKEDA